MFVCISPGITHLVTCSGDRVVRVTAAGFAAPPAGQIPVVGGTVVTPQTDDIRQTLALPRGALAHTLITLHTLATLRAQEVTRALWEGIERGDASWGLYVRGIIYSSYTVFLWSGAGKSRTFKWFRTFNLKDI